VGGGTTLVEARLAGRSALGSDLNPLAAFVTRVKTHPYADRELDAVRKWAKVLPELTDLRRKAPSVAEWAAAGYMRNIDGSTLWRVRRLLGLALESLTVLKLGPTQDLARCVVLRTAQWALDMRSDIPTARVLREALTATAEAMVEAASTYARAIQVADATYPNPTHGRTTILEQGLPGLTERIAGRFPAPRLVLLAPEEVLVGVAAAVLVEAGRPPVRVIRQPPSSAAGCR
jgi:hypothetical protein